jgi:hypothetical protein
MNSGSLVDQNFRAIKLGDVNGSWTPPAAGNGSNVKRKTPESIIIGEVNSVSGKTIAIPVSVVQLGSLTALQFTIKWDPSQLNLITVTNLGLPGLTVSNFNLTLKQYGVLTLSWDSPSGLNVPLAQKTDLLQMHMTVLEPAERFAQVAWQESPTPFELTVDLQPVGAKKVNGGVLVSGYPKSSSLQPSLKIIQLGGDGTAELSIGGPAGAKVDLETATSMNRWGLEETLTIPDVGFLQRVVPIKEFLSNGQYWRVKYTP